VEGNDRCLICKAMFVEVLKKTMNNSGKAYECEFSSSVYRACGRIMEWTQIRKQFLEYISVFSYASSTNYTCVSTALTRNIQLQGKTVEESQISE
jgi:hypothetical protein